MAKRKQSKPQHSLATVPTSTQPAAVEFVRSQMTKVFGDSGTARWAGYYMEEKNSAWRDAERIDNVQEMRKTDGTVKAMLNAFKSPIIRAGFSVFSYDNTPKGKEIRESVEKQLFNLEGRSWPEFVREGLSYLDFGHYAFELIWDIQDGQIVLKDLAPRIPGSILRWKNNEGQKGIVQLLKTDDVKDLEAFIPMEKLLVFTNEKEGDDITGTSILRSAYLHFKMKNLAYRIGGVSIDRFGVGTPVVTLPEDFGDADKDAAEEMAENIRSSEKGYVVLPHGWQFEIITPSGNPVASQIDSFIKHHNDEMLMSVLAGFLGLGTGDVGSFALSSDQSSFFLQHCEEKADYFVAQINKQVIKRMVDANYGPQESYPELRHNPLGNKDLKSLAETMNTLAMAGFLSADSEMLKWTREMFRYPELKDDQVEENEAEDEKDSVAEDIEEPEGDAEEEMNEKSVKLSEKFKPFRKLTEQEARMDLQKLSEVFDDNEEDLEDDLTSVTSAEIDRYVAAAQKKLDAGDIAGVAAMSYMLFGPVKDAISKIIKKSYEEGKTSAVKDLKIDRPATPKTDMAVMAMDADDLARAYQFELEQKSRDAIKNAVMSGASVQATAVAAKQAAKEAATKMITNMGGTIVGQYVNRGRTGVFQKNLTEIKAFQRSEVLDEVTCDTCISLDGQTIGPSDPMAQLDIVHTNCRGVWVPIFEEDTEQPEITGIPQKIVNAFETVDGRPTVNAFKQLKKPIGVVSAKAESIIRNKMNR